MKKRNCLPHRSPCCWPSQWSQHLGECWWPWLGCEAALSASSGCLSAPRTDAAVQRTASSCAQRTKDVHCPVCLLKALEGGKKSSFLKQQFTGLIQVVVDHHAGFIVYFVVLSCAVLYWFVLYCIMLHVLTPHHQNLAGSHSV